VEVLRFGPGSRRSQEQNGARGLDEQTIWSDPRARVTELAFGPRAVLPPRTSPQHGLFIVVSGGGWVQVGEDRTAIHHGEAVEWPALLVHGAWTDGSHMRALLVEVPDAPPLGAPGPGDGIVGSIPGVISARATDAVSAPPPAAPRVESARGGLTERPARPEDHDPAEGEPW
jgi:quercetin dioxygenase-like cupin family protein